MVIRMLVVHKNATVSDRSIGYVEIDVYMDIFVE